MRDRLVELINNYPCMSTAEDCFIESISSDFADYLRANGVVVLPCKVGDVVYQTDGVNIYENEVCEISLSKRAVIYYTENAVAFDETALGKSIFLTKEEAERALKGGERDE